jgi:hypothetical protein
LENIKKNNDKKFIEIQQNEENIRRENFFNSLEKNKKRQKKEEEVKKKMEKNEEELRLFKDKLDKEDEIRKFNEKKKREIEENKIQHNRVKRSIKYYDLKNLIDQNFTNRINTIQDRQKNLSLRKSHKTSIMEEKQLENFYKSQEKEFQKKIKVKINHTEIEEKIQMQKEVLNYIY